MSPRRAAVLGSPVAHSLSPQLHLAAYRALGLADWTYDRIECTAEELPGTVAAMGPEWVGLSVTMPGKFAALQVADERTERAALVGSANTLVRTGPGWRADNTDIDGVAGALAGLDGLRSAVVLGSGGTAPAAVVALAGMGVAELVVAARSRERAARLVDLGGALGMRVRHRDLGGAGLAAAAAGRTSWSARCPPMRRPATPRSCAVFRCCWTRSTTPGPPRWPGRSPGPGVWSSAVG